MNPISFGKYSFQLESDKVFEKFKAMSDVSRREIEWRMNMLDVKNKVVIHVLFGVIYEQKPWN